MSHFRVRAAVRAAHATRALARAANAAQTLLDVVVPAALDEAELGRATVGIYDGSGIYAEREPFVWEPGWFASTLADVEGTVLVVAGGGGAEALQIAQLFPRLVLVSTDGSPRLAAVAQRRLDRLHRGRHRALALQFEELIADAPVAVSLPATVDAVVVGWGALSHVATQQRRAELLRALDRRCPHGPILFSCLVAGSDGEGGRLTSAVGARLGSALVRHVGRPGGGVEGDRFHAHVGFSHSFTSEELQWLAASVGRALVIDAQGTTYPHGRFLVRTDVAPPHEHDASCC